jgi:hypothetical protein
VPGPASGADVALARKNGDVVSAKEADDLNIAAGKEDLTGNFESLLDSIDAIPDSGERSRAYDFLYCVVNGAVRIAKSGFDPLNELQRSEHKQAAEMRARKEKKHAKTRTERDKIVLSMVDRNKSSKQPSSAGRLLARVNDELVKNGHEEM